MTRSAGARLVRHLSKLVEMQVVVALGFCDVDY